MSFSGFYVEQTSLEIFWLNLLFFSFFVLNISSINYQTRACADSWITSLSSSLSPSCSISLLPFLPLSLPCFPFLFFLPSLLSFLSFVLYFSFSSLFPSQIPTSLNSLTKALLTSVETQAFHSRCCPKNKRCFASSSPPSPDNLCLCCVSILVRNLAFCLPSQWESPAVGCGCYSYLCRVCRKDNKLFPQGGSLTVSYW